MYLTPFPVLAVAALVAVATAQTVTEVADSGVTITTAGGVADVIRDRSLGTRSNAGNWVFGTHCFPDIVSIGPFTGFHREGWEPETQPNYVFPMFLPCLIDGIFGPNARVATMCANNTHLAESWGFGCSMPRRSGSWMYWNTGGHNVITFNTAAPGKFGGYFGSINPDAPDATIAFFDPDGNQVCQQLIQYQNDCTWRWFGWEMNVPIKRIEIWNFSGDGGFVMMDDLEYTQGSCGGPCNPCDMNCDGVVNALDIEYFIDLVFGGMPCCGNKGDPGSTGDVNCDGSINAADIEGFINCLFP